MIIKVERNCVTCHFCEDCDYETQIMKVKCGALPPKAPFIPFIREGQDCPDWKAGYLSDESMLRRNLQIL